MGLAQKQIDWVLVPFEKTTATARLRVFGQLAWNHSDIELSYRIEGPVEELVLPERGDGPTAFALGLWKKSCCEFFLGLDGEAGYTEWNFAPAGEWARYDFSDYRQAEVLPSLSSAIHATSMRSGPSGQREMKVSLRLGAASARLGWALQNGVALRAGVTVVLEHRDGERSHWALKHPTDRADFHASTNFALLLK